MTEKQKMLAGQYYNTRDAELLAMYHKARGLLMRYNTLDSRDTAQRELLLSQLLGSKGAGVWIEAPFFCDYGENISIGANTFVNTNCIFLDDNLIQIGCNGLIAPYVQIYTASHPLKAADRIVCATDDPTVATYLTCSKPVTVGDNVWIGGNTVVMPGVTIGHNVTIGAGSVVTRDIPNDVLAMGNPCRVVRNL